jgi:hypothetical protein
MMMMAASVRVNVQRPGGSGAEHRLRLGISVMWDDGMWTEGERVYEDGVHNLIGE